MASSFGGINTALTSLYAQRRALDVTGQNIANANTEGYTRQRAEMQSQVGSISPAMYSRTDGLGTGVAVSDVQRLRDEFLENRGRAEHSKSSYLTQTTSAYNSIEDMFAEPGDTALAAQMHDMWGGWNDVSNNPQLAATRSTLLQQSSTVADGLNSAHSSLAAQWSQNNTQLSAYVNEVNTAATSIAQLNDSIVKAKATGLTVNELEDRRDLQVMKLSELTGATASARANGAVDVFVGNSTLVSEFTTRNLEVSGARRLDDQNADPMTLRWADTKTAVQAGGTMGAMADTMTTIIPAISDALDAVAKNLADKVNALHSSGYSKDGGTGRDFFTSSSGGDITAGTIRLAITDPDEVAVSGAPGTLDNTIAEQMADIGEAMDGPDREYRGMIGQLGVASQATIRRNDIQATVTEQVDASREAYSGVNLDEEMTNLLTYQRGYEAASRVLTTIDSMLDQLINRTGLVGR
ncbi:flagellar hook-associated protein FlgK [Actinoplanes sp. NBRC 103695]|uniref:flagellar hook-associated protein FlgK n=1 Tax=Actinoplanes sp. NBRC 103695 TaxID=3032202 RepID=UPI0024A21B0B|nr:flagellar hook-associated protein FlgK [Actinoplanes sp. NBRC 103695]GLY96856.1 flagellar hook-associated protein 1 [Actinoplanes sp. NBRC 103695]